MEPRPSPFRKFAFTYLALAFGFTGNGVLLGLIPALLAHFLLHFGFLSSWGCFVAVFVAIRLGMDLRMTARMMRLHGLDVGEAARLTRVRRLLPPVYARTEVSDFIARYDKLRVLPFDRDTFNRLLGDVMDYVERNGHHIGRVHPLPIMDTAAEMLKSMEAILAPLPIGPSRGWENAPGWLGVRP